MKLGDVVELGGRKFTAAPEQEEGTCVGCVGDTTCSGNILFPLCGMCTTSLYEP